MSVYKVANTGDYIEQTLDLNQYLAGNSKTIFCVHVEGDSMIEADIHDNDILVVDRSIEPTDGKIVIACVNSELTVKRLKLERDKIILMPENPEYPPILVTEETDVKIWGVVIHRIHAFYDTRVEAGPPSNVANGGDYIKQTLDLNQYLAGNSNTIFCIQVEGDPMIGAGIHDNDILVVDRSIEPRDGKVVIACVNSELTVKRLKLKEDKVILMSENPRYSPILITGETDLKIWGVVIHGIHALD